VIEEKLMDFDKNFKMLIDGELVSSNSQIDVYNPATKMNSRLCLPKSKGVPLDLPLQKSQV